MRCLCCDQNYRGERAACEAVRTSLSHQRIDKQDRGAGWGWQTGHNIGQEFFLKCPTNTQKIGLKTKIKRKQTNHNTVVVAVHHNLTHCPIVPVPHCPSAPLSRCAIVPVSWCPSVPLSLCPSVLVFQCNQGGKNKTYEQGEEQTGGGGKGTI